MMDDLRGQIAALAIISGHIGGTVPARRKEIDEARARALWQEMERRLHPARLRETIVPFPEPVGSVVIDSLRKTETVPAVTTYERVACGSCPQLLGLVRLVRLAGDLRIGGIEVPAPVVSAALCHPAGWAPARAVARLKAEPRLRVFVAEHWRLRQPARWRDRTMRDHVDLTSMGVVVRCPRCGRWTEMEKTKD